MDARALLRGMGWTEGQGLGKSNQGISQAIKPKVQLDRKGLGLNPAASLVEPWWAKVFNQTAKNVSVEDVASEKQSPKKKRSLDKEHSHDETGRGARIKKKTKKKMKRSKPNELTPAENESASESNSVNAHIASISRSLYMGSFTKGTTLTAGQSFSKSEEDENAVGGEETVCDEPHLNPIDEELWRSCNGRTAHKGARYGVLKGKMARLVRQEQAMAAKSCDTSS